MLKILQTTRLRNRKSNFAFSKYKTTNPKTYNLGFFLKTDGYINKLILQFVEFCNEPLQRQLFNNWHKIAVNKQTLQYEYSCNANQYLELNYDWKNICICLGCYLSYFETQVNLTKASGTRICCEFSLAMSMNINVCALVSV